MNMDSIFKKFEKDIKKLIDQRAKEKLYTTEEIIKLMKKCIEEGRKCLPNAYRFNNGDTLTEEFEYYLKAQNKKENK